MHEGWGASQLHGKKTKDCKVGDGEEWIYQGIGTRGMFAQRTKCKHVNIGVDLVNSEHWKSDGTIVFDTWITENKICSV